MNAFVAVKIQKINAYEWKFSKLMFRNENSEMNAFVRVKIQKINAYEWKFRSLMLTSAQSEN